MTRQAVRADDLLEIIRRDKLSGTAGELFRNNFAIFLLPFTCVPAPAIRFAAGGEETGDEVISE